MNPYIIYIILAIVFIGLASWLAWIIFKDRNEERDDVLWDTKFCPSLTKGYTKLSQKDVKIGKTGRLIVTCEARDIDYRKAEKDHIKLPIIIKFAIPPELVETLSKGDSSKDMHEKIAFPRHAKDIPYKLRHTAFGESWAEHIENNNRTRSVEEIMTKDNHAQTKIAEMLSHDNLLTELTNALEGFQKFQSEMIKDAKKPAPPSYNAPLSGNRDGNN